MGLTSFPSVPIWLASQMMGLGTLSPPEVNWERCTDYDKCIRTSCLLATASLEEVNKRKLFNLYDGSSESSYFISHTLYPSNLPASCSWDWD